MQGEFLPVMWLLPTPGQPCLLIDHVNRMYNCPVTQQNKALQNSIHLLNLQGSMLACPGFHLFSARMLLICSGLCIYPRSHQQKIGDIPAIIMVLPPIFVNTKEFSKNTKENLVSDNFCSHLLQEGRIDFIPLSECCICIALSIDTNIGHF
jgi:hypothetical protein